MWEKEEKEKEHRQKSLIRPTTEDKLEVENGISNNSRT
jgi:hypothetical protein